MRLRPRPRSDSLRPCLREHSFPAASGKGGGAAARAHDHAPAATAYAASTPSHPSSCSYEASGRCEAPRVECRLACRLCSRDSRPRPPSAARLQPTPRGCLGSHGSARQCYVSLLQRSIERPKFCADGEEEGEADAAVSPVNGVTGGAAATLCPRHFAPHRVFGYVIVRIPIIASGSAQLRARRSRAPLSSSCVALVRVCAELRERKHC